MGISNNIAFKYISLLGHGTAQIRAPHSSAFDVQAARAAIAPLRVEEMEPWLRLGIAPQA